MKSIDGEKLIAYLRRYGHETISVDGLEGLIDVMENVHESCKDADLISRQAAIDAMWTIRRQQQMLDDSHKADLVMHGIHLAEKALEKLPSAQPVQKIGYWIPVHPLQADDEGAYLCSNCNTGDWDIKPTDKYCKFCGAKMQGVKKV